MMEMAGTPTLPFFATVRATEPSPSKNPAAQARSSFVAIRVPYNHPGSTQGESVTDKTETTSKANLKLVARNEVIARLIESHQSEYHALMEKAYTKRGLTYERPLSETEKAHQAILDLIAKHGSDVIPDPSEISAAVKASQPPEPEMVEVVEDTTTPEETA